MSNKELADAYGVLVRAGAITPQLPDEEKLRAALQLPVASKDVKRAWNEDGGVRRPITIASADDTAAPSEK